MLAKLKTLGIEKSQILHTAESLFHDHAPANARAWPRAGSTAATARRAPARPWPWRKRLAMIFASTAWPTRQSPSGGCSGLRRLSGRLFPLHVAEGRSASVRRSERNGKAADRLRGFRQGRHPDRPHRHGPAVRAGAKPSYKIEVDFGPIGRKWSSAQITTYSEAELIGRLVACVVNMPPRNIAGFQSEVLILGAKNARAEVILLSPLAEIALGEPVF